MRKLLMILLWSVLPVAGASVSWTASGEGVPVVKMAVERLPDLTIPRSGCGMALGSGGEPVVFGGHTTGFVPTQTAEYFADGAWHELEMMYPHDFAFLLPLRSGRILLGGGVDEPFGIGQSWGTETYDPAAHAFTPSPILDRRRALCSAAELEDGTVVVSGNWYADDAIGTCRPGEPFESAGKVSAHRTRPYVLPSGPSDAIVFGSLGNYGEPLTEGWVDRLAGEPFVNPLLTEWRPLPLGDDGAGAEACRIGDYAYLVAGQREDGAMAVLLVRGEEFSLLPLAAEIPLSIGSERIVYSGALQVDRAARVAWLTGWASMDTYPVILLRIGYGEALDGGAASLALYYAEPSDRLIGAGARLLLPDGSLLMAGGITDDNFNPYSAVYRFLPDGQEPWLPSKKSRLGWLLGLLCGILTGCLAVFAGWRLRRRSFAPAQDDRRNAQDGPAVILSEAKNLSADPLMPRIAALMEEQEYFRHKGLTLQDVAQALGSNTKYISSCINAEAGCPFNEYLNGYRVRYVQAFLRAHPDTLLSVAAEQAGFSGTTSFFRNFKAATGKTPSQWLREQQRPV